MKYYLVFHAPLRREELLFVLILGIGLKMPSLVKVGAHTQTHTQREAGGAMVNLMSKVLSSWAS